MMSDEDGKVARGFMVIGRVQGVGFRWWTEATARALGVGGFVRNLPDGSVEVQAVGAGDDVERFAEALGQGPPGAHVVEIRPHPANSGADRVAFEVRYGSGD